MIVFRWFFGLPFAALITAALFILMAGLISPSNDEYPKPTPPPDLSITSKIKPEPFDPDRPKLIDHREKQPETIIEPTLPGENPGPVTINPDPGAGPSDDGQRSLKLGGPMIRVAPPYPEACRSRGVEGDVLVQFDVTPEGNVVNVQIISAPDRCFHRIVSAVAKWKYPPAYQNERPVMRYGVIERFHFELTE